MKSVCFLPIIENPHLSTICLGRLLVISFFSIVSMSNPVTLATSSKAIPRFNKFFGHFGAAFYNSLGPSFCPSFCSSFCSSFLPVDSVGVYKQQAFCSEFVPKSS